MLTLSLKPGRDRRIRQGHPWVFAGEVQQLPDPETNGDLFQLRDARGQFLGVGFSNTRSNILLRLLSRKPDEAIDREFLRRRLQEAIALRRRLVRDTEAMRLVHAEADGLPGLVVDQYGRFLVIQLVALGMEVRRADIVALLAEMVQPEGIYERSDVPVRALEGLEPTAGVVFGAAPPEGLVVREGIYRFRVDLVAGQKTGFFLDQRPNRAFVGALAQSLSPGARVLNAFCYTGGFGIPAATGGAEVLNVDVSEEAIAVGRQNAELNGVADRCRWEAANAFDRLRSLEKEGERFDLIVLDPPAFTKSKESVAGAIRGYKEINLRAMRLLQPGGLLVTSSCSHHIDAPTFVSVLQQAAMDNRQTLQQLALRGAGMDHPVLPGAPETSYLKCFIGTVR